MPDRVPVSGSNIHRPISDGATLSYPDSTHGPNNELSIKRTAVPFFADCAHDERPIPRSDQVPLVRIAETAIARRARLQWNGGAGAREQPPASILRRDRRTKRGVRSGQGGKSVPHLRIDLSASLLRDRRAELDIGRPRRYHNLNGVVGRCRVSSEVAGMFRRIACRIRSRRRLNAYDSELQCALPSCEPSPSMDDIGPSSSLTVMTRSNRTSSHVVCKSGMAVSSWTTSHR